MALYFAVGSSALGTSHSFSWLRYTRTRAPCLVTATCTGSLFHGDFDSALTPPEALPSNRISIFVCHVGPPGHTVNVKRLSEDCQG